jgi:hypothetical protein
VQISFLWYSSTFAEAAFDVTTIVLDVRSKLKPKTEPGDIFFKFASPNDLRAIVNWKAFLLVALQQNRSWE